MQIPSQGPGVAILMAFSPLPAFTSHGSGSRSRSRSITPQKIRKIPKRSPEKHPGPIPLLWAFYELNSPATPDSPAPPPFASGLPTPKGSSLGATKAQSYYNFTKSEKLIIQNASDLVSVGLREDVLTEKKVWDLLLLNFLNYTIVGFHPKWNKDLYFKVFKINFF